MHASVCLFLLKPPIEVKSPCFPIYLKAFLAKQEEGGGFVKGENSKKQFSALLLIYSLPKNAD
jgi:hypothetical protein